MIEKQLLEAIGEFYRIESRLPQDAYLEIELFDRLINETRIFLNGPNATLFGVNLWPVRDPKVPLRIGQV